MSKELKVTDLRVGDKVREKATGFELIVTSIFWSIHSPLTEATLSVDFEGNEGDVWEMELEEVELIDDEPKSKEIDWEARRYEIAKDVVANSESRGPIPPTEMHGVAHFAIMMADELIKQLNMTEINLMNKEN